MEQLSNAMHAATADPPPTSIDLDQIIAGQRRRGHLRTSVAAAAAVAVLGIVVMTVPSLLAARQGGRASPGGGPSAVCAKQGRPSLQPRGPLVHGSQQGPPTNTDVSASPDIIEDPGLPTAGIPVGSALPTGGFAPPAGGTAPASDGAASPSDGAASPEVDPGGPIIGTSPTGVPQPTENCGIAERRLTADVTRLLRQDLPAARFTIPNGRSTMFEQFEAQPGYVGAIAIDTGSATYDLSMMLDATAPVSVAGCRPSLTNAAGCIAEPDGTAIFMTDNSDPATLLTVVVQRPDNTHISLTLTPRGTVSASPLTGGQLADLGRALTLFP